MNQHNEMISFLFARASVSIVIMWILNMWHT